MATIQKFYFHDATSADTGTFPTTWQGTPVASQTATGASINRAMDGTAGTTQVATATLTLAAGILGWYRQFTSAPLGAQTIASGTWTSVGAGLKATSAGAPGYDVMVFAWRPSTGAAVGTIFDSAGTVLGTDFTTAENGGGGTFTGAAVTTQDGDVLIVQIALIEDTGIGSAAGCLFDYDGTTDPVDATSASSAASYLNAPAAITLQNVTPGVLATVNFAYGPN